MAAMDFELPRALEAREPAEVRGRGRDDVRLLVSRGTAHPELACFKDFPKLLDPGDLVVINTSATLPAAIRGRVGDRSVDVHLSGRLPDGFWLAELRRPATLPAAGMGPRLPEEGGNGAPPETAKPPAARPAAGLGPGLQEEGGVGAPPGTAKPPAAWPASLPEPGCREGEVVTLPGGGLAKLLARWRGSSRLWVVALDLPVDDLSFVQAHGRPIRYAHVTKDWPLSTYQTVYASTPGSAEMPSAGRALTHEIFTALAARGISVSPLELHAGVSSMEGDEAPPPEWYRVPAFTAQRVNDARAARRRVVAVGTTVVRALETVVDEDGVVHAGMGWTQVMVTPDRPVRGVDGLLTGWHEPRASHLLMLQAIAEPFALETAYRCALASGFLWHEFGDLHLILPEGS